MQRDRTLLWIIAFALVKVLLHSLVNTRYGFHRDELQVIADSRELVWGYVAYPPLTPFFARAAFALFGESIVGLRLIAALVQSAVIVVAALIARTVGGGKAAQWLTAAFVAVSPVSLAASSLFQYVTFDVLWWVLIAFLLAKAIESDDPRWWVPIGLAIGLGVLTKYSIAFLVAGVVATVVVSPLLRRHLKSRWLWSGVLLSIAIALPNLVWQMRHGWISLEFLSYIHARDIRIGRTDHFLVEQLYVATNLFSLPLWIAGVWALAASERLRRFRPLLVLALVPMLLFTIAKGRGYYTTGIFPLLVAAGAVALEPWARSRPRVSTAVAAALLLLAVTMVPVAVPLAPIGSPLFRAVTRVNGDWVEEIGWPELTAETARVYRSLPPAERARTAIFCGNYGEAGALDLYGPALGLPRPISGTNSFWLRGYRDGTATTVIVLGQTADDVRDSCSSVTKAGTVMNRYGIANEESRDHPDIFLCRGLKVPWPAIWRSSRSFG